MMRSMAGCRQREEEYEVIVVHGEATIRPEIRDTWLASASAAGPASRQEEGCLTFVYTADIFEPDRFHVFEVWQDAEIFARHIRAPHHVKRVAELKKLGVYWPEVTYYEATEVSREAAMGRELVSS